MIPMARIIIESDTVLDKKEMRTILQEGLARVQEKKYSQHEDYIQEKEVTEIEVKHKTDREE
jgi:hypothetical protein